MVSKCFAKRAVLKKGGQRAFSEGKKEGILGRPVKKAREGTKRAKPETVIYPTDRLCEGVLDLKLKSGAEPYLTNRVQRVNFHEMPGCMRALKEHIDGGLMVEHDDKIHGELKWLFYGQ